MIHCEYRFCIYQLNNKCTLDEIDLQAGGYCFSCIVIELEEELLQQKKAELRYKLGD